MEISKIPTSIGEIVVNKTNDKMYPGFYIALKKNGETLAETMLEVDRSEDEPVCKIHIWDSTSDEPICDMHGYAHGDYMALEEY